MILDTFTQEDVYKLIKNKLRPNGDSYTVKTNSLKSVGTVMNDNRTCHQYATTLLFFLN